MQDLKVGMTLYDPWAENAGSAGLWAEVIKAHHMGSKINWPNSNATMWGGAEGFYEAIKLFCAPMGKHADAIKRTSAASVDFTSLTAMMQMCDHFKANNSEGAEKQRRQLLRAVAGVRSRWAHVAQQEITKEESDRHLGALCALLEREPHLASLPEARLTLEKVERIRNGDWRIAVTELTKGISAGRAEFIGN
jgi:hypothetical protein